MVLYFGHYVLRAVTPFEFFDRYILHESGATEQGTVLVLVLALLTGLLVLRLASSLGDKRLLLFFGLFCLGCLYFGGEEASWGQHWFGWATPEEWRALNNQAETNLHNSNALAGSLLDQLPRNLMTVGMLIGGVIGLNWKSGRLRTALVLWRTLCIQLMTLHPAEWKAPTGRATERSGRAPRSEVARLVPHLAPHALDLALRRRQR